MRTLSWMLICLRLALRDAAALGSADARAQIVGELRREKADMSGGLLGVGLVIRLDKVLLNETTGRWAEHSLT